MEALTQASHKLAEIVYKQTTAQPGAGAADPNQATPPPNGGGNGADKDRKVVNAEFDEVSG